MAEHHRDFLRPQIDSFAEPVLEPMSGVKDRVLASAGELAFSRIGEQIGRTEDGHLWAIPDGGGHRAVIEITDPDRFMRNLIPYKDVGLFYGYTGGAGEDVLWRPDADRTYIPEDVDTGNPEADSLVSLTTALYMATQGLRKAQWSMASRSRIANRRDAKALEEWEQDTGRTKAEIAAHYDISQEIYTGEYGFLDERFVQYSSGLLLPGQKFESLEQLQEQKVESLARKLELDTAETLLEVGGGWGGLAVALAERYPNLHITSLTVSEEQLKRAQQRAREAGVEDRVTFVGKDYRDLDDDEVFDRIVSVEMIEAVAWPDMPVYFNALAKHVDPEKGIIVLQSINTKPEQFAQQRHNKSFANTAIFPGGVLTPEQFIKNSMAERGWRTHEETELGPSYAPTLREWLRNLHAHKKALTAVWEARGIPSENIERFYRGFSFYLASCQAAFRPEMSHLQDWQLTFRPEKLPTVA